MFHFVLICNILFLVFKKSDADYITSCSYEDHRHFSCKPEIYWCSSENRVVTCERSECGYSDDAVTVKIKSACFIPSGFFKNSQVLEKVYGRNAGIEMIGSKAFFQLPNIVNIILPFNSIRYILQDTFVNVSVKHLDLSWNKISYIEDGALSNLLQLEKLDLSFNDLFQHPELPKNVREVLFAYNDLTFVLLAGRVTVANFTSNKLKTIALSTTTSMKMLDISVNELSDSNQFQFINVSKLILGFNNFIDYPSYREWNPKEISLYPNPWDCDSLRATWQSLYDARVNVIRTSLDETFSGVGESFPVCISYHDRNKEFIRDKFRNLYRPFVNAQNCWSDLNCAEDEICRNGRCWNACNFDMCDPKAKCVADKRQFDCVCPKNQTINPFIDKSRCYLVECFVHNDCSQGQFCRRGACEIF